MNDWSLLEDYPPKLVRCLARNKLRGKRIEAKSDEEIALDSELLTVDDVRRVYSNKSWDNVKVKELRAFCKGCDFNPNRSQDRNRAKAYYNQPSGAKFTYLKKSPWWESIFAPLIQQMRDDVR